MTLTFDLETMLIYRKQDHIVLTIYNSMRVENMALTLLDVTMDSPICPTYSKQMYKIISHFTTFYGERKLFKHISKIINLNTILECSLIYIQF